MVVFVTEGRGDCAVPDNTSARAVDKKECKYQERQSIEKAGWGKGRGDEERGGERRIDGKAKGNKEKGRREFERRRERGRE